MPANCPKLLSFMFLALGLGACGDVDETGQLCREVGKIRSCGGELVRMCTRDTPTSKLRWGECRPQQVPDVTPLVLRFGEEPVAFTPFSGLEEATSFDIEEGTSCAHDWPSQGSPWLALDRNGNGRIDGGAELFGSGTELLSGERAENGFVALAELDTNADGILDLEDEAFEELELWWDHDGDRDSDARELTSLTGLGVEAISLDYWVDEACDDRGNCGRERATMIFTTRDGMTRSGQVVDVHLACHE